ncbi:MAG TPA: prephenate dehydrogenase/arogenate dehydrogenase family protein [Acidimicrobiales bacterium]|nr:prephenate dehydrogenase/arogenate dehydrogenase family protein [Acidimicrobiales bacterium]
MTSRSRTAAVVGTGLIGGSIGLALRSLGWHVTGFDHDEARANRALEVGAVDDLGASFDAVDLAFIATPVGSVARAVNDSFASGAAVVTDVGSVKSSIVSSVDSPRFVGGHPMAGSEQEGVDGATATMFEGAVWVLTPTPSTDHDAHALVRATVKSFGADVVELAPDRHDALVAVVSHVPQLTASSLMVLAADRAEEHRAMLRLAAGGFRDMTRIASGHPGIWPDICAENREAIVSTLTGLEDALRRVREIVERGDRDALLDVLERARRARVNLPPRVASIAEMAEVRVPVPDRPGVLAEVTTLASELGVNIADFEIAHSAEGNQGVLVLLVPVDAAERFTGGLMARGYRSSWQSLE